MKRQRSTKKRYKKKKKLTEERYNLGLIQYRKERPEIKVFDFNQDTTITLCATNLAPTATALFVPTQGTDLQNRIGRKVQIQTIHLRGMFSAQNLTTLVDLPQGLFMALILDRTPNGSNPFNYGDVFANVNATVNNNGFNFRNPNTRKRYKVLYYTQLVTPQVSFLTQAGVGGATGFNPGSGTINGTIIWDQTWNPKFDIFLNARKLRIGTSIFGANAGAYSDLEENGLLIWFWNGQPPSGTTNNSFTVNYSMRTTFTDV